LEKKEELVGQGIRSDKKSQIDWGILLIPKKVKSKQSRAEQNCLGGLTRLGGKTIRETRRGEWNPMMEKRSGNGPVTAEVRCWLLLLTLLVFPPMEIDGVLGLVLVFLPRRRGAARRWDWNGIESSGWVALRCNLQLAAAAVESFVTAEV
jgi:hypothetical protein